MIAILISIMVLAFALAAFGTVLQFAFEVLGAIDASTAVCLVITVVCLMALL